MLLIIVLLAQRLHANAYSEELKQTVSQANSVRDELEKILENSLSVSELIIDRLDTGVGNLEYSVPSEKEALAIGESEEDGTAPSFSGPVINKTGERIRLYELARKLDMNSRELLQRLEEMGYSYSHHMNLIDPETADLIRERIASGDNSVLLLTPSAEEESNRDNLASLRFPLGEIKAAHPYLAVRSLHENGYSIKEIAQILERGQGEIELILNLTHKKTVI